MSSFPDRLRHLWPPGEWGPCGVVVAVSGGADSVALLRGLHEIAGPDRAALCVAHVDHQMRGPEGAADALFVGGLARELGLDSEIVALDVRAAQRGGEGSEAAARGLRYQFLRRVAESRGLRYVAVAHTADDQAETVLHRLLRGAGVQGLAAMSRARPLGPAVSVLRPLLSVRRQELRDYLESIGQAWRTDATNSDARYTRNRLRLRLAPLLEQEFGPQVVPAVCRAAALAGEAHQVIQGEAARLADAAVIDLQPSVAVLAAGVIRSAAPIVAGELLRIVWRRQNWPERNMRFADWRALAEMAGATDDASERMLPGGVRARKKGDQLWLTRP